jgi:hypothetical protein
MVRGGEEKGGVACWSDDEASGADATWRPRPALAERRRPCWAAEAGSIFFRAHLLNYNRPSLEPQRCLVVPKNGEELFG